MTKLEAMDDAFKEFNAFGLASQSDEYKLLEKDCVATKALGQIIIKKVS